MSRFHCCTYGDGVLVTAASLPLPWTSINAWFLSKTRMPDRGNGSYPTAVERLMTPPANLPYSGPRLLVWTCMASCVGMTVTTFRYAPFVSDRSLLNDLP